MDPYSSGEDLIIKTRKPYTITKQRERWTEEEHNRFLEALKLYGRAWQRIEEHIGTKTAVQIRSHAQKFFTKLEKEALVKGVPIGKAIDIEIPPPRPKRKPSNPYPRKTNVTPASHVGSKDAEILTTNTSLLPGKHVLDLEKEPLPEKTGGDENLGNVDEKHNEDNSSEVLSLFCEAPCASLSSANGNSVPKPVTPRNSCAFREFLPILKEGNAACDTSDLGNSHPAHEKSAAGQKKEELSQHENFTGSSTNDMQVPQNCPRNVPVHCLDGRTEMSTLSVSPDLSYQESMFHHAEIPRPNMFANPATSATTEHHNNAARPSIHQSFASIYSHFAPFCNDPDDYQSFLQLSSRFSSLILSVLLQNPASHAAASFAATFWPFANVEASADSPAATHGGCPSRQINSAPSMAAIAAATVAAATAWWAAHGLFPFCAPIHASFTCTSSATATQTDNSQARAPKNGKTKTAHDTIFPDQQVDAEHSEAVQEKHSASKLLSSSSSDSEESKNTKVKTSTTAAETEQAVQVSELHDLNKAKSRKQVDRSSCGSNTPSSSEVETDALHKHEKGKEESKEPDVTHPASDSINRRGRSSISSNDSWKEVSEEGRLAFRALFSREVLPQSFSPPHDLKKDEHQKSGIKKDICIVGDKNEDILMLDLGNKIGAPCSSHQDVETKVSIKSQNNGEDGLLTIGLGHGKLKARRTGFKPYKRCFIEAEESKVGTAGASYQEEEKGPKRIRLDGEAAT